jgi:cell division transport system permease protein
MNLILGTTFKYIRRNPGLSLASIVIITVTFSLGTIFFVLNQFANKSVAYLQSQPTLSIFYDPKEKEENILKFKGTLEKSTGVEKVTYSTSADIQKQYLTSIGISADQQGQYTFDANQIRILRVQLKPNVDYLPFVKMVDDAKNNGALIIDRVFFQDIVDKIRQFSNTVTVSSLVITVFLLIISLVMVYLTIGFTINRFAQEIEIMELVGAESKIIATPFILQGAFYGTIAAFISFTSIVAIWAIAVVILKDNILFEFIRDMMTSVGLRDLFRPSLLFIIFGAIELSLGTAIGYGCSFFATKRYIK